MAFIFWIVAFATIILNTSHDHSTDPGALVFAMAAIACHIVHTRNCIVAAIKERP